MTEYSVKKTENRPLSYKKKVLVVTTVGSTVDQFVMPSIRLLVEMGFEVSVACNFLEGNTCTDLQINRMKNRFEKMGVKYYQIDYCRSILKFHRILKGRRQLKKLISEEHFDIIHCHTPIAGAVIRTLANKDRKAGRTKVVYTAHGFHFYKGSSLPTWLVFYPVEKFCSRLTDVLITINTDDYELSKRKMKAGKIVLIPGIGVDIEGIQKRLPGEEEKEEFRKYLGLYDETIRDSENKAGSDGDSSKKGTFEYYDSNGSIEEKNDLMGSTDRVDRYANLKKMFLSVGELNKNKNHQIVLKALSEMKDKKPGLEWKYFICGKGEMKDELVRLADNLGIGDRVVFTGFTDEIMKYYACADLFIFPSYREGLSVAVMEAIAAKLPVICSDIRGNRDQVSEEARFDPTDSGEICDKILKFLEPETAEKAVNDNIELLQKCRMDRVTELLREVYEGLETE